MTFGMRYGETRDYFAWRPVELFGGGYAWLIRVQKFRGCCMSTPFTEYRLIDEPGEK